MPNDNIFSGLKVVDLASFIAGPSAAVILSDFGADVIKVEPPGTGDPYRYLYRTPPNPPLATNYTWQLTNRNKRSLAVDLKNPLSAEVLARLVEALDRGMPGSRKVDFRRAHHERRVHSGGTGGIQFSSRVGEKEKLILW